MRDTVSQKLKLRVVASCIGSTLLDVRRMPGENKKKKNEKNKLKKIYEKRN